MKESIAGLTTEQINPRTTDIDLKSSYEIVEIMNNEDFYVVDAVKKELPNIAKAVDRIYESMKNGGRLFYVGAGTSGRLGVLDASECPPTFGVEPWLVNGIIAGGTDALTRAIEGAEDNFELGASEIYANGMKPGDVCVGIAASGRTPYVLGAVDEAKKNGIFTIGLSNNDNSPLQKEADLAITPVPGPEVVLGSTRLKSGTSQKMTLNMLTTAVMIRLGKTYGNLMVDLSPSNHKLRLRAVGIIMKATGVTETEADDFLEKSGGSAKTAIVMIKTGSSRLQAEELLKNGNGYVSKAIAESGENNI